MFELIDTFNNRLISRHRTLKRLFDGQSKYATWEEFLKGLNIQVAH